MNLKVTDSTCEGRQSRMVDGLSTSHIGQSLPPVAVLSSVFPGKEFSQLYADTNTGFSNLMLP